jgi:protein-export membrane protein SecD
VDEFGVSEPTIQKYGANRIIVELAGVQDSERARNLIQRTASLEFNLVLNEQQFTSAIEKIDNYLVVNAPETKTDVAEEKPQNEAEGEVEEDLEAIFEAEDILEDVSDSFATPDDVLSEKPFSGYLKALPGGFGVIENEYDAVKTILENEDVQKQIPREGKFLWGSRFESIQVDDGSFITYRLLFYIATRPEISGGMVQNPQATIASTGSNVSGQWVVNLSMSNEGTRKWSRFTGANIGKQVAIVLDNHVYMAPSIQDKIPTGRTQISGFADVNEAKDIANVLRAGELPAPVNIIEERTVGPSLGSDSITSGRKAMMYGFLGVMIFMLIYYRGSGILANIALLLNLIIVIAILAGIDATLTLPGIAGLILTIGMAVDANVIIFERIREELANGKTARAAIESGYERAFLTIFDANITTLIAAFVLAGMGSGPIKGFAITLSTGIVCSMFTAVFVTRTIFMTFSNNKPLEKLSI